MTKVGSSSPQENVVRFRLEHNDSFVIVVALKATRSLQGAETDRALHHRGGHRKTAVTFSDEVGQESHFSGRIDPV
jgi:hypothetical protein